MSAISQKVNYARISAEWNLSPPKENTADGHALNVGRDVLIRPKMDQRLCPTQSEPNAFQNWKSNLLFIHFIDILMGSLLSTS